MAGEYVLWFDARSSACRRALEILRARGIEPTLRRYLEERPTPDEVRALLKKLCRSAHEVIRPDEDEVRALRLSDRTPEAELVEAIATHPRILERPILATAHRAVVARPPEELFALLSPPREPSARLEGPGATAPGPPEGPGSDPFPEPVALPLDGTLDLHAFSPKDVTSLVPEWIGACAAAGLREVRVVHGKGIGALRQTVHALLARDGRVESFRLAGEGAGGWGATLVTLKPGSP